MVFLYKSIFSQVPTFYSFSEQHNFWPQNIYSLGEDSVGNVWIGTNEGLYQWDGQSFTLFQNKNFSSEYSIVKTDKTGRVWCQNFSGQLFYVEKDSLKLFEDVSHYVTSNLEYTIKHFPKIFLGTEHGIFHYDFFTKSKFHYSDIDSTSINFNKRDSVRLKKKINRLTYLVPYKKGHIIMEHGCFFLDENFKLNKIGDAIDGIFKIEIDGVNVEFNFSTGLGQLKYIVQLLKCTDSGNYNMSFGVDIETSLFECEKDLVWLAGEQGLFIKNIAENNLKKVAPYQISSILKDKEGNIWFSSLKSGLYIVPSKDVCGVKLSKDADNKIEAIMPTKFGLYFVSSKGDVYKNQGNSFKKITSFNLPPKYVLNYSKTNLLSIENGAYVLDLNSQEKILEPYGTDIKDFTSINKHVAIVSSSSNATIRIFNKDRTFLSIFDYNKEWEKKIQAHRDGFEEIILLNNRSTQNVYDDQNKVIYIKSITGITAVQNNSNKLIVDTNNNEVFIACYLLKNKDGGIYIGTKTGRLYSYNKSALHYIDSLPISIDKLVRWKNYLFILSEKGVVKYNLTSKNYHFINKQDGLYSNHLLDIGIYKDTLYISTNKGLNLLPCSYSYINNIKPTVSITGILVNREQQKLQASYQFKHDFNDLTISFKAISTRSQGDFKYQYRLNGLDSTWKTQSSIVNFLEYPSLPPGNYVFQIKAVNEDNIESDVREFKLFIDKPFYQKWWFYLLIVLLVVLMTSLFFLIRIKILKNTHQLLQEKKEVEKKLSKTQLSALKSQMNPHFVFNALNSIQDYILSNEKLLAAGYLGTFADLMRKYLDYSQEDEISIHDEIETLKMYLSLEKVRFEESFIYEIDVDPTIDVNQITIPVMVIQPFVENAIKHGLFHKKGDKNLKIAFSIERSFLKVTVEDNGVGREVSEEINKKRNKMHKSFATSAIQKRIDLLNRNEGVEINVIYYDLQNNEGTRVELFFKLDFFV